jgi:hypothetical protein
VVVKSPGWYARWISATEVAFLDRDGTLEKLDVSEPSKRKTGRRACGNILPCSSLEPQPYLEWTSPDLDQAIVRGSAGEAVAVGSGEPALITTNESGFKAVALGVNAKGTTCKFMAPSAPGTGHLQCAEPPWTTWRRVRDFHVDVAIDNVDGDAHIRFFSEREVLLSLPPNEGLRSHKYNHCIVALASSAARCASERAEWWPLGDGRWSIELAVISTKPTQLIDVTRGKSWATGKDTQAVWWQPKKDACKPGEIVLQREDKADVRAGRLTLPDP